MDLKLTDHDLEISGGELKLVEDKDSIAQAITMRLRTWLGESPYDLNAGLPYMEIIFARGTSDAAIRFIIEQAILEVPGVTDVLEIEIKRNNTTREATITGLARIDTGEAISIVA